MREILGRRRRLRSPAQRREAWTSSTRRSPAPRQWQWPVLPGVGRAAGPRAGPRLRLPRPRCAVPGAHPFDPGLLAATTDARMVRWWWTNRPGRPDRPGHRRHGALRGEPARPSPAARALAALDRMGMRLGPVVATPTRWSLLVAPYSLEQLGELLLRQGLRAQFAALPRRGRLSRCCRPSETGRGRGPLGARPPLPGSGGPPGCRMSRPWWTRWSRRAPAHRAAQPTRLLTCRARTVDRSLVRVQRTSRSAGIGRAAISRARSPRRYLRADEIAA